MMGENNPQGALEFSFSLIRVHEVFNETLVIIN